MSKLKGHGREDSSAVQETPFALVTSDRRVVGRAKESKSNNLKMTLSLPGMPEGAITDRLTPIEPSSSSFPQKAPIPGNPSASPRKSRTRFSAKKASIASGCYRKRHIITKMNGVTQ